MHHLDKLKSIPQAFLEIAANEPQRILFAYAKAQAFPVTDSVARTWTQVSFGAVKQRVLRIASYLQSLGIKKGDRVAIIASARPEWVEADLAALLCGCVVVSVYPSLLSHEMAYLLYDSGTSVVFAENSEQVLKLFSILAGPSILPATEALSERSVNISLKKIIAFEVVESHDLVAPFAEVLNNSACYSDSAQCSIERHDLASLVYTSGTTGPPKGVMQTHANHLSNVRQAWEAKMYNRDNSVFLFLPLAHSFAKLMSYLGIVAGARIIFPAVTDPKSSKQNPSSISRDMREAGAEIIPVVPRLLEKMQSAILKRADSLSILGLLLRVTLVAARAHLAARRAGGSPSFLLSVLFLATSPIRKKTRRALFGEKFHYAVSGGAKLPVEVAEFFESLEVEILEGYGLTETCVATNVNRLGQKKIGSVGPALSPDVEMKIASDGEILFRGPNVTQGYFKREDATRASWDAEGWFHSGDVGSIDVDGFLWIEGRKKELIVTSGGKKIAPSRIEEMLTSSKYISQAALFGEGKPYCVAVVTLDQAMIPAALLDKSKPQKEDYYKNPKIKELIAKELEKVNSQLASFETVKSFWIAPQDFTLENGLLTPTFKVKRKEVEKLYRGEIAALYTKVE